MQTPMVGIVELSESNVRTTRAEVEVDQDAEGNVIDVRVVRASHVAGFDRAAVEAVRAAIPLQERVPLPGGRRSRWSFDVLASRDPILPMVGMAFDESSGWFEFHWPGRLHVRSRVWMERAGPLPPRS
ncbi:MAG: TonB family protein [Polyangiales bacterium]